jgi:3-oxoacyl-[acyl-carrier-protein] synthase-1
VAVTGVGAVTAVGANAAQTLTSIRAGIRRVAERPLAGAGGDPGEEGGVYLASSAEALAQVLGAAGPLELAVAAAREALWDAGLYEPRDVEAAYRRLSVAVFLALPAEDAPWADPSAPAAFLEAAVSARLVDRAGTKAVPVPGGHAAGLLALEAAAGRLLAGDVDVALVGGLDGLLGPAAIPELDRRSKLRTDRAPGGLIPGEGSAFVVLERLDDAKRRRAAPLATLEGTGRGTEPVPLDGPEPSRGDGATRAVAAALAAGAPAGRITDVWTDLNGERNRALEWALVETRALASQPAGWRRREPASIVGDLGAAAAPLLLALAVETIRKTRGAGGAALVCAASDRGERAAAVLGAPRPGGKG